MERTIIFLWMLLVSLSCIGQTVPRASTDASGSMGVGVRDGNLTFSVFRHWSIDPEQHFQIGLGLRYTGYLGANQDFITAPAKLTSGTTGPLVFFKENIMENIDTFLIKSALVNSVNLALSFAHRITDRFYGGFNIDLIGYSFGNHPRGNYINESRGKRIYARPTALNLLLISDNDIGSLNSELYIGYKCKGLWAVKGGFQFLFTEYTTDLAVQQFPEANDRFRNKSLMVFAGVSRKLIN